MSDMTTIPSFVGLIFSFSLFAMSNVMNTKPSSRRLLFQLSYIYVDTTFFYSISFLFLHDWNHEWKIHRLKKKQNTSKNR